MLPVDNGGIWLVQPHRCRYICFEPRDFLVEFTGVGFCRESKDSFKFGAVTYLRWRLDSDSDSDLGVGEGLDGAHGYN